MIKFLYCLLVLCICTCSQLLYAQHVNSIDGIQPIVKGSENIAKYDEQMMGKELPDGFGTNLPVNVSKSDILKLVVPQVLDKKPFLVGCKKWPYQENMYISIVIFGEDGDYSGDVYLAMLEYDGDVVKKIAGSAATYAEGLNVKFDWGSTNCDCPMVNEEGSLLPQEYQKFDFAKYQISDHKIAFGIRVGWFEGYSGGGAFFQGLMLFVQDEDKIENVFAEPMGYFKNIAGDWNEDSTREHFITQEENVLIILPHKTNGYFDIKLSSINGTWSRLFTWDKNQGRYL
jgi:hypothetical protein